MSAGINVQGPSGNTAEVSTTSALKVALPQTQTDGVGYAGIAAVVSESGSAGRVVRAGDISVNRRARAANDNLLFNDRFSYGAQNTSVWTAVVTTMTQTFAGGYTLLNAGGSVANAAVARFATYKFFPVYDGAGTSVEFDAVLTQAPQTNNVVELGLFQAAGTAAPTDGVFFRYTAGGALVGVTSYNGAELTVTLPTPTTGVDHAYRLVVQQELAEFWIDGVLQGILVTPANQNGPCQCPYQPLTARVYNNGVPAVAQILKLGSVRAFLLDVTVPRSWGTVLAGMGGQGAQGQSGQVQGQTSNYVNNLAVGAGAAATNTTAAVGSGLGGQFTLLPTLAVSTDGILMSYQNPVGTAANPGKTLLVYGVRIQAVVSATLATAGTLIGLLALAFGHTAVSMATTEAAATKAPRRKTLGVMTFATNAVLGTQADREVSVRYEVPVAVNPGEFLAVLIKNIGTVSTAGTVTFLIDFDTGAE